MLFLVGKRGFVLVSKTILPIMEKAVFGPFLATVGAPISKKYNLGLATTAEAFVFVVDFSNSTLISVFCQQMAVQGFFIERRIYSLSP